MAEEKKETSNQIATFDQKLALAKSVKDIFEIPDVEERFIKNYEAQTSRKDGKNRFQQERFAYMEMIHDKPALKQAPMWAHFSAIVKAGTTGLSFRSKRLYAQPLTNKDGVVVGIKVDPSPAGRREMLEMMMTVKQAPEAQVVCKGDIFIHDKLTQTISKHETTEKSLPADKLENITHAYQRIIWKDGTITDVVVPNFDLVKAKSKSKVKGDGGVWEWIEEACKKVATNRAFDRYHKYNDNVVVIGGDEANDDSITPHEDVTYEPPTQTEHVDEDTGEVTKEPKSQAQEAQIVSQPKPEKEKKQYNLLDE
jgi:recombinational DNA repair protein RecT